MKTMIFKLSALLLLLLLPLIWAGCEKNKNSDYVEGYIVGSFKCNDSVGRGFCIILANDADSIWTFSVPENIIDFPSGVIKPGHDVFTGGPYFFPDSLRYEFNIRFKYRQPSKPEVVDCSLAFNAMGVPFPWEDWHYVIVEDVSESFISLN